MVFSTTNLFKGIQCPAGADCRLTNCIFSHDSQPQRVVAQPPTAVQPTTTQVQDTPQSDTSEPATKRRKITYSSLAEKPISRADQIRHQLASSRAESTVNASKSEIVSTGSTLTKTPDSVSSIKRPISPPAISKKEPILKKENPAKGTSSSSTEKQDRSSTVKPPTKPETLNPRLIPNDPAGHAKRSLYLKHLHAETVRLNGLVVGPIRVEFKAHFPLSQQLLMKLVLDEEEKLAREKGSVYSNVIKQRIAYLKKVSVAEWAKKIADKLSAEGADETKKNEFPIETRMTLQQEVLFLPHLKADQQKLKDFEYIPDPPTAEQIQAAIVGVEQSRNYEECGRCAAHFQVFPDRNEQGLLASNGPCRFHPRRKVFPPRQKTDRETGAKAAYFPCCMEAIGSPGCTEHENHVFKTTSPSRLAAVLPFVVTPENPSPPKARSGEVVKAVTFDCEMGYTTCGLELIRLTAITWPQNEELVDVLVRPLGTVIDLNSRFSGIFPEHFRDAVPYEEWVLDPKRAVAGHGNPLPVVQNPQKAREILCSYLTPETSLIGHAINNDLNSVRLCHPTIIDTILLYPHPKGLPMRFGLKMLTQKYINRAIQTGGDQGHDSKEDAIATGDLLRIKVGEKWRQLRASGWKLIETELIPPSLSTNVVVPPSELVADMCSENGRDTTTAGTKRKRSSHDVIDAT